MLLPILAGCKILSSYKNIYLIFHANNTRILISTTVVLVFLFFTVLKTVVTDFKPLNSVKLRQTSSFHQTLNNTAVYSHL